MTEKPSEQCWVCGESLFVHYKTSDFAESGISANDFRITDANYGKTAALNRCLGCGFIQATQFDSVLKYYQAMDDQTYEDTREQRALQARKLLQKLKKRIPQGSLLDVGAGSGILVEEALKLGFEADGIEPSTWLVKQALNRKLPVYEGILPHPSLKPQYDIITLVDVIEHVSNPVEILSEMKKVLKPNGIILIVTPDVSALVPKLMKSKWWHFRLAHIGYFDTKTLNLAMERSGFQKVSIFRPCWYFPMDYIFERLKKFLFFLKPFRLPKFFQHVTIPINPLDSLAAICTPSRIEAHERVR